jgi:LysR family transcriptional regulator (chromosome initiation inhibitor)
MDIDYKLLRALNIVIQKQSFERAANKLNISQSAVSQRIKLLEEFVGHPVLIREKPICLTPIGHQLLAHFKQVELLERDLLPKIVADSPQQSIKLSLAVNADSLATWFINALSPLVKVQPIELDILVADESRTTDKLKSGEAFGALSTMSHPLTGYKTDYVGYLRYVLVATEAFKRRYFDDGVDKRSLRKAPAVAYDQLDNTHFQFIEKEFQLESGSYPCHTVRSSESFVELVKNDIAYALIPELQIQDELSNKIFVNLLPNQCMNSKLYWHSWVLGKGVFRDASALIINYAREYLPQEVEPQKAS